MNTDVFCFAPPDMSHDDVPLGVLHPASSDEGRRRWRPRLWQPDGHPDGQRRGLLRQRYLGNPLVYCGNVGILPKEKSFKCTKPSDLIVAMGGRTGRDGIHGATFSSAELTHESEELSGGAVQIGNAITEKMVLDVLLEARDRGLYTAVTDCGAGGFSSAVGEMGEKIGAEVWLERIPLKYEGLSYTEMWISEAQERMVFAVPEAKSGNELQDLVRVGRGRGNGHRQVRARPATELKYNDIKVADLSMEFLHDGRPPVVREAIYHTAAGQAASTLRSRIVDCTDDACTAILGSLNVASKHWIIRQYDHEVQGGSVVKPLVGVKNDGPGDASVMRPVLGSRRGDRRLLRHEPVLRRPRYVSHGGQRRSTKRSATAWPSGPIPTRIAILDNFCWGTHRPARDARLAGPRGPGVLRRLDRLGHPVYQRQGQPEQRVPARGCGRADLDPAIAADQRDGPGRRRPAASRWI